MKKKKLNKSENPFTYSLVYLNLAFFNLHSRIKLPQSDAGSMTRTFAVFAGCIYCNA